MYYVYIHVCGPGIRYATLGMQFPGKDYTHGPSCVVPCSSIQAHELKAVCGFMVQDAYRAGNRR